MILRLQSDHGVLVSQDDISRHIYDFFLTLLVTAEGKVLRLRDDFWGEESRVSQAENDGLALTFSTQEIDEALGSMKCDTAPGPAGWPVIFFRRFWPALKDIFYDIINGFALGMVDISRLNYGVISLIPKVKGADSIKQYRPITLINVPFKICAKAYASRLAPVAQRVIHKSQTTFLKGRNILEGPIALTEIIHELKRTRGQGVILKLDFEKAYDRVNWEFVREVLLKKGFEAGFVHRIMHLISSGNTSIIVNGDMGKFFRNRKGLRQGDPVSPLVFNFVADALAALLSKSREAGHITGLVPHLIPGGVPPLQYADDTLLLFNPDDHSIASKKLFLLAFELLSGLKSNFHKSEVITMG